MALLNDLSAELALRDPQRLALVRLDALLREIDLRSTPLEDIEASAPGVKFDTPFPSVCFALAPGVGKTLLMAAHIAYLHEIHGYRDFFILTPGDTIYRKTVANFTAGDPKSVGPVLSHLPEINLVTGDSYTDTQYTQKLDDPSYVNVFVFNIQKIFTGREDTFQFFELQENLGQSFAELLQQMPDLVVLMDESHRYRGEASLAAVENLKPLLGLEYTATPVSKNILYEFGLDRAIGRYVKTPRVLARTDRLFKGEQEEAKLRDGIMIHERKRALVSEYSQAGDVPYVKPVMFVVAQNIAHANEIGQLLESEDFEDAAYAGKVLVITQKSEEEQIQKLLALEESDNEYEIVVHVNKLKEGWDVKNIWTIVPLRASVSEILTEQTIGRGLRLPWGELTGDDELDTLDIVSHDRYSEVVEKGKKWVQAGVRIVEDEGERDRLVVLEVRVREGDEEWMNLPILDASVSASLDLSDFSLLPSKTFEQPEEEIKLVATKLASGERLFLEGAWKPEVEDAATYLTRAVLASSREVNPEDAVLLQTKIQGYVDALDADQARDELVMRFGEVVVADIVDQIKRQREDSTMVVFSETGAKVHLTAYTKAVLPGQEARPRPEVFERRAVVVGYEKQPYEGVAFDSKPEKYLADALEDDGKVIAWLKPPRGQAVIQWRGGSYNVDFFVQLKNGHMYALEMKDKRSIEKQDRDVFAKARAAADWADAAATATGEPWHYALIIEDAVKPQTATFEMAIAQAVDPIVFAEDSADTARSNGASSNDASAEVA